MTDAVIRTAYSEDAANIAAIHEAAVTGELGRGCYSEAQIHAWAHPRPLARLREQITTRRFLIAESKGDPVGYAQLDVETATLALGLRPARPLASGSRSPPDGSGL